MPLVIGHRGSRQKAVENTLESLNIAAAQGAQGVEFDVQLSADGELVLFHDDTLKRLANRPEAPLELPWKALRQLELREPNRPHERMTHLDEVLDWATTRPQLHINLELKVNRRDTSGGRVLADTLVRRMREVPAKNWLISSFDRAPLEHIAEARPDLALAALIDVKPSCDWWPLTMENPQSQLKLTSVNPHHALVTKHHVPQWKQHKWQIWTWTANHPREWEVLCEQEVEAIITDVPDALLHFLARHGKR